MAQQYFDESRETEEHALPDCETFEFDPILTFEFDGYAAQGCSCSECGEIPKRLAHSEATNRPLCGTCFVAENPRGWYWQACFPGCLPDGEPNGPFATEAEALADARND